MEKILGVDIGGTNVKIGVVDLKGNLLEKKKFNTKKLRADGKFLENFMDVLDEFLKEHNEITKVGIGVPGMISKDRKVTLELANIPDLNGVKFIPRLERKFKNISFYLENDANAAALGELHFSKRKLPDHFIFVTLGTGVGGAAIIDRKIFKGGDGNAMEIGHIISSYGKSVENKIGKKGILKMAGKILEKYEGETMLNLKNMVDSKTVVEAAHKQDKLALEVFSQVGKILGEALVSTIKILDIKTVLIGGGVSETFSYLQKSMHKTLEKHMTDYYSKDLEIKMATLGNNAGILGAASLCFKNQNISVTQE